MENFPFLSRRKRGGWREKKERNGGENFIPQHTFVSPAFGKNRNRQYVGLRRNEIPDVQLKIRTAKWNTAASKRPILFLKSE